MYVIINQELFVKYGSIEQSKIETDKKGKSEERGYVVYRDNDAANRAISDLNGINFSGRKLCLRKYYPSQVLNLKEESLQSSS